MERSQSVRIEVTPHKVVELFVPPEFREQSPAIIFAPGAGKPVDSLFFEKICEMLFPRAGVFRFNFPYQVAGRKFPDSAGILADSWRLVIRHVRTHYPVRRLYLGGKSMGGRYASMVASEHPDLAGLIFLGYPFHPAGRPEKVRDSHLYELRQRMLFIQGGRDALAKPEIVQSVLTRLGERAALLTIPEGDHSFKPPSRSGLNYEGILRDVANAVWAWIERA